MHIGLCIVSTKFTNKLKFWILRTGNKRMTRTSITCAFFVQIFGKLNNVFQLFTGSLFSDISNWTLPYINVTTQNPKDDCAFFYMLYLENYNGRDWEMDIEMNMVS
jgi:hypothetical protein